MRFGWDYSTQRVSCIMGTGLGIFWIDWMCKPFLKGLMKQPELIVLLICCIYGYIAYKLVKTAYLSDMH